MIRLSIVISFILVISGCSSSQPIFLAHGTERWVAVRVGIFWGIQGEIDIPDDSGVGMSGGSCSANGCSSR